MTAKTRSSDREMRKPKNVVAKIKKTDSRPERSPRLGKLLALPATELVGERKTVTLKPDAAVMSILQQLVVQVSQTEIMKVSLNSFCEGRGLEGQWSLRITGAELVPVK